MPEWSDTLFHFLDSSNEDQVYDALFRRILRDRDVRFIDRNHLCFWIDIGSGPGTKTLDLASILCEMTEDFKIELYAIEPDNELSKPLRDSMRSLPCASRLSVEVLSCSFQEFCDIASTPTPVSLVTALQVLYDPALDATLGTFLSGPRIEAGATFLASVESPGSDLAILRSSLRCEGVRVPEVATDSVLAALSRSGWVVRSETVLGEVLRLPEIRDVADLSMSWIPAFVLGQTCQQYREQDEALRLAVETKVFRWLWDRQEIALPQEVIIANLS